jgi:hypothetical protein
MTVDTHIWNILPLAALFAGCRPETIPVDEGETGNGDSSGDGDGDGDPGSDDNWCDTDPCPEGWECISSGSSGYCYPECDFAAGVCNLGEICIDNSCEPLDELPECQGPTLIELPIPAPAQGDVLDLSFGDLDGDGLDELLVLHAGEVVVVRDGLTSSTVAVDPLADEINALRIDDDAALDIFLSGVQDDHAAVLLGVGDGSLMPPEPRTLLGLQHTRAIDWQTGGANELVGIDANLAAVRVSNLADDAPDTHPVAQGPLQIDPVVAIHPTDFDADGNDDVLIHRVRFFGDGQHSTATLVSSLEGPSAGFYFQSNDASDSDRSTTFARTSELEWGHVFTLHHGAWTDIHVYSGIDRDSVRIIASSEIRDLTHVGGLGLVLATASDTKLIEMNDLALVCVASPDALSASTRVVAGNFADNPGDELALVDDAGVIRVWGRLP